MRKDPSQNMLPVGLLMVPSSLVIALLAIASLAVGQEDRPQNPDNAPSLLTNENVAAISMTTFIGLAVAVAVVLFFSIRKGAVCRHLQIERQLGKFNMMGQK